LTQTQYSREVTFGEDQTSMLEPLLLLSICLLIGLACFGVVVWLALSGRIVNLDGLSLALMSLAIGVFFLFNVAWSYRTGELRQLLDSVRKGRSAGQE
jgi:hypothetical protein